MCPPTAQSALPFSQHSSFPVCLVVRGKKRRPYAAFLSPAYRRAAQGGGCAPGARVLMSFGVGCQSSVHAVTKTFQPSQHNKQWCFFWKYLSFFLPEKDEWLITLFLRWADDINIQSAAQRGAQRTNQCTCQDSPWTDKPRGKAR